MVHISRVHLPGWRRFTDLTIADIPANTRLVVLAGPNGLGKSSIFDSFRVWQGRHIGNNWDPLYYQKIGSPAPANPLSVSIEFHEPLIDTAEFVRSAFTFRTAYRMEADFSSNSFSVQPPLDQSPRIGRMNETDAAVSQNFQRLIAQAVGELFGSDRDKRIGQVQDEMLGLTRDAMWRIFGDLNVENLTDPLQGGAFFFSKGQSRNWHYKNLSGGERAAFDLILDMAVKRAAFPRAVYCIDEPETHLNTRVQATLLRELLALVPQDAQLWIATHSIGMLKEAKRRQETSGDVAFLDFEGHDMDSPTVIRPTRITRQFWLKTLQIALDDLADLVAPRTVVIVEGRPTWSETRGSNAEFDAICLRKIFADEFPDTEFISVGSAEDVESDSLKLGSTTPLLSSGTRVIRVVDRDDRSQEEVELLQAGGVQVLGERDLENYLLSDEMLLAICNAHDASVGPDAVAHKHELLSKNSDDGHPPDDVKRASGPLYVWLKKALHLRQVGNRAPEFLRDTMTKFVTPGTATYAALKEAIFDSP